MAEHVLNLNPTDEELKAMFKEIEKAFDKRPAIEYEWPLMTPAISKAIDEYIEAINK